jgi:hypothetical protein
VFIAPVKLKVPVAKSTATVRDLTPKFSALLWIYGDPANWWCNDATLGQFRINVDGARPYQLGTSNPPVITAGLIRCKFPLPGSKPNTDQFFADCLQFDVVSPEFIVPPTQTYYDTTRRESQSILPDFWTTVAPGDYRVRVTQRDCTIDFIPADPRNFIPADPRTPPFYVTQTILAAD